MSKPIEVREPNEDANTDEMIDILRRKMERDYAQGSTLRDAHPKAVGLLRGVFTIEPDLPRKLQVGIFAKPRRFDCWLRLSNSSGKPQSDAVADARGFAIKLMSARGKGADEVAFGQDFVLLSTPVMPLGTVAKFRDAVYYTIESNPLLLGAKFLLTGKVFALIGLAGLRIRPSSHLDIRYWSTTPYRFGAAHAVKYSLLPTSSHRSTLPALKGANYLRDALQSHLSKHEATFDFCVQLQAEGMPIEDAAVEWSEKKSPFIKVATVTISKQKFRTRQRDELAESLSFSPGHALPEHEPLGGLNRARIKIYTMLSKFRHQRDGRKDL